jgi:anti-anti-sigma factor
MHLEISTARREGWLVLGLKGRLDAVSAAELEARLRAALDAGDRRVALDLAGVDYVSSAGLRVFLATARELSAGAGQLALCAPGERVREVLDMSGLSFRLDLFPSLREALAVGHGP